MEREARRREGFACLLALLLAVAIAFTPITAWAEGLSSDESSVSISLTSDQESYQRGDEATFIAVIANEDEEPVNEVSYSLELPSGMTVAEDSSLTDDLGTIAPGDSVEVTVKALVEGVKALAAPSALASTGDFPVLPILGGVALVAAVVALLASKKSRNITLSVILVCGMSGVLGAGAYASTAYAAERNSVSDSISVTVDGSDSSATMTVFYAPGSLQQPSGGEGDSSDEGDASITRAQWVEKMLAAAEIQVSGDAESPYTDISGHSSEKAIATAYKLGAFADEQTEFAPDSPATREFALTSAVLIAGFHDDGSILEAADADDASHPSLLAIAVDLGMASIDDQGNIRPNDAISSAEADSVLEALSSTLAPDLPGEDGASIKLQDDVISIGEYEINSDGAYIVSSSENAIAEGDKVAFTGSEENPQGAAGIVTSVVPLDETTSAVVIDQADSPDQIFESIRIVSSGLTPNAEDVVLAEDVEWDTDAASFAREAATTRKLNFKVKLGEDETLKVSVQPTFDVDVDWSLFGGLKRCNIGTGVEFSTSCSAEFASIGGKPEKLATIPVQIVPGVVSLDCELYLHVEASGKVSIDAKASLESGVKLKGDHWRTYIDGDSEVSAQLKAKAEIGVAPAAAIAVFSVNVVDLAVEAGIAGEGSVTQRDTGMVCNDIALYLYDKLTVGEHSPILEAMGLTASWDLWTKSNSPFSWDLHAEDGVFVDECTYGKDVPGQPGNQDPDKPAGPASPTTSDDYRYVVLTEEDKPNEYGEVLIDGNVYRYHGSGVYVIDYVGDSADILVPDALDGTPIVSFGYSGDSISSITVEGNNSLKEIDMRRAEGLKSLDAANCQALEIIDFDPYGTGDSADLISLDVSGCVSLKQLLLGTSSLSGLDLSNCPDLELIDVRGSSISQLDLGNCKVLRELYVPGNDLTRLDISANEALVYLQCDNNELTELDISNNPNLTSLTCSGNRIADLSALQSWLEQEGHFGSIEPQNI